MSGGEQQMLAIARAMMARARMILLDEPSEGIMPVLVDEMFALFAHEGESEPPSCWSSRTSSARWAFRTAPTS